MGKQSNLAPLAGLALGLTAVVGYFALIMRQVPALSRFLEWPIINLALLAAGVVLSLIGVRRAYSRPERHRGRVLAPLFGALNLGLAGLFCIFLFVFTSGLPPADDAPQVGATALDFTLPDDRGEPLQLSSLRGRKTVLVFYRGFW